MQQNERDYLRTKEWQDKRLERLRLDNFRCVRCGTPHNIQVHHTNYSLLGDEDVYNDLITLCNSCHESIEKETRNGCFYKQPLNYGSNFGIKSMEEFPVENAILYTDMQYIDPERQLQLKGGKIRLCRVHLSANDFLNNEEEYNEYRNEGVRLAAYSEYQYEPITRRWDVFIEMKEWVHTLPMNNVITNGHIAHLNNGISVLHIDSHSCFESYKSVTKTVAEELSDRLLVLEENYKKLAHIA